MFKIIAETAFSHEGDFSFLKKQIKSAKKAKVDFIKFQVFLNKDDYIVKKHPGYESLDKWMFSEKQWIEAFELAKSMNLRILALPIDNSSAKFCVENDNLINIYEVHSVCFNEIQILEQLGKTSKKIVLGVGGRLPQEIEFALNILNKKQKDIVLMYGFQSFPTDKSMLDLNKIKKLKQLFGCEIGYADHNSFDNDEFYQLNNFAYILGATYFEKHIVLDKGNKRIDFESAISVNDFIEMKNQLTSLEQILGFGNIFSLNKKEIAYKNREKQIVAKRNIKKGEIVKKEDICYRISEVKSDFEQSDFDKITNKKARTDINVGDAIKYEYLA